MPSPRKHPVRAGEEQWRTGSRYSLPQIKAAFSHMVRAGTLRDAAAAIADDREHFPDLRPTRETLRVWQRDMPELWAQTREEIGPIIEAETVDQARGIVELATQKERELLQALDVSALDARDIPGALRNISTTKALQHDKVIMPLTGRPSSYTAPASAEDNLAALRKLFAEAAEAAPTPKHVDAQSTAQELEAPKHEQPEHHEQPEQQSGGTSNETES